MPAKQFFLDETKTDYILISWDGYYKNVRVSHNGHHMGGFADIHELRRGYVYNLYDGSQLHIYLSSEWNNAGLKINRNGIPVPGSSGDPQMKLRGLFVLCIIFAIINIIVGVRTLDDPFSRTGMDTGLVEIIIGVVIAALGVCIWKFYSIVALIFAMIVIAGNAILYVFASLDVSHKMSTPFLFYKVFVFITLIRGFGAIREYRHRQKPGGNIFPPPNPFQPQ